jgi:hypothetical protein
VGERGGVPRPVVVGLNSEEEKRIILARSRQLRGGQYDNVAVVPDLTKMQRRGEDKLNVEAGERNKNLTVEDNERGLRWIVVGKRGEKRLIKGVEREPQRDRGNNTLGQYMQRSSNRYGGNGATGGGGGGGDYSNGGTSSRQGVELGARPRDNQYRLLPPVNRNDPYVPVQHLEGGGNGGIGPYQQNPQHQRSVNSGQQQHQQHYSSHNQRSVNNGQQQQQYNQTGQQQQYRQLNNNGGMGNIVNVNGGGRDQLNTYNGGGFGGGAEPNNRSGYAATSGYDGGYGNGDGYGNGYSNGDRNAERRLTPYEMGQEFDRQQSGFNMTTNNSNADGNCRGTIPENTQLVETDRLVMRPGGLSEPVVPQPGQQRQRLGSKRGASNTSTDLSPPRTRQRQ